jgi:hypothetical protein
MHSPDLYEGSDPPLQQLTTCSNEYVYVSYKSMTLLHLLSFLSSHFWPISFLHYLLFNLQTEFSSP